MHTSWIKALVAAVEYGSVEAAARAHNMTRQGLRKRISNLEAATGVELLAADARGTLTKAGEERFKKFQQILDAADEVLNLEPAA
ncbi:LysR family transcriptional regulator [Nocardioides sp. NPDC006273]|uniref:LysR family transcriptional regulator n=1 Tax=Nocardioides sp. NPDC006273 TaxID=3155598 RepID=UPI0033BA7582